MFKFLLIPFNIPKVIIVNLFQFFYIFSKFNICILLRVWSVKDKKYLLTLCGEEGACPTSVCWVVGEAGHCIVGYSSAACCIMDTETGQVVTRLDTAQDPVSGQV